MVGAFLRNFPFGTEIAFAKGLERRGHTVHRIDPGYPNQVWDDDADATIVFKWIDLGLKDVYERLERCAGLKVVYQPDDARFPHIKEMIRGMRGFCTHLLSFDDYGAEYALTVGYLDAETLRVTADDELYCPDSNVERDIDVSFVGSLTAGPNHASRMEMCRLVQAWANANGKTTWFGETYFSVPGYPSPLDIYRRSKVVLNHATDVGQPFGWGHGFQCRHFEVGMAGVFLLSNMVYGERFELLHTQYGNETQLINKLETYLGTGGGVLFDREVLAGFHRNNILREHMPEHRADQIVSFVKRNT
jgi:hypothetical protein